MTISFFSSEFKEDHWHEFVLLSRKYINEYPPEVQNYLDHLSIPEDIKDIIIFRMRENASTWVNKKIPILENMTPIDLLNSVEGTRALKAGLLRMPD